jgi:outer membrane protein TolC
MSVPVILNKGEPPMNRIAFAVVCVGLIAVAGLFVSSGRAEPTTPVRKLDAEKLTALRKERRDVLRQAVKQTEEAYRNGVKDYTSIPRVTINLLNAELDLATDHAGRVAVRERIVEQSQAIEKSVAQRVENALADSTDLLEATAARLQAEIDLLRETADEK